MVILLGQQEQQRDVYVVRLTNLGPFRIHKRIIDLHSAVTVVEQETSISIELDVDVEVLIATTLISDM